MRQFAVVVGPKTSLNESSNLRGKFYPSLRSWQKANHRAKTISFLAFFFFFWKLPCPKKGELNSQHILREILASTLNNLEKTMGNESLCGGCLVCTVNPLGVALRVRLGNVPKNTTEQRQGSVLAIHCRDVYILY